MEEEPHQRLRAARRKLGFPTAAAAARAFGWNETTYRAHESGGRGIRPNEAKKYARAYHMSAETLVFNGTRSPGTPPVVQRVRVPLVGYVGAGAETYFTEPGGELDEVDLPALASERTVAVEIRGTSLGRFFDRWLVFYDDVRRPLSPDLIGRLCVLGASDGRTLVKVPQRAKSRGLFHLLSQDEPPILDAAIDWAARVKLIAPR